MVYILPLTTKSYTLGCELYGIACEGGDLFHKKSMVVIVVALIAAWKIAYPTNSFRYKVTVNVETPEGLKSGSAVREARIYQQPEVGDNGPWTNVFGEAVVVDLGARGVLFATLDTDDHYLVFRTFSEGPPGLTRKGARYYEQLRAKAVVDPLNYPLLVAFKDIKDPKTITVAYKPLKQRDNNKPGIQYKIVGVEDNMAELFGNGVRLKDITIEMTKVQITRNVIEYLPWLDLYRNRRFDGNDSAAIPVEGPLASLISVGRFYSRRKNEQ